VIKEHKGMNHIYEPENMGIDNIYHYFTVANKKEGDYMKNYYNSQIHTVDNIISHEIYLNNKLDGEQLYYHRNGELKIAYNFKNDKLHGESRFYDINGKQYSCTYFKNGTREGESLRDEILFKKEIKRIRLSFKQ